jgi:hypothetical protein
MKNKKQILELMNRVMDDLDSISMLLDGNVLNECENLVDSDNDPDGEAERILNFTDNLRAMANDLS